MFFVQFEATPRRNAMMGDEAAGALVNCWIERPTQEEAVAVARELIRSQGWFVDDPEVAYPVDDATYPPGKQGREYYRQALIDREVFVFHCYAEDDEQEGDDSHED